MLADFLFSCVSMSVPDGSCKDNALAAEIYDHVVHPMGLCEIL